MSKKRQQLHQRVGEWLARHPDVRQEKITTQDLKGGRRYRYGHLTLTWYHTGTVMVQGAGIGNVVFKHLNCPTCQGQPKVIQALAWMFNQVNKKVKLREVIDPVTGQVRKLNEVLKRAGSKERIDYHRDLDKRIRERKKA